MKVQASSLRKGAVVDLEGKLYVVLQAQNIQVAAGSETSRVLTHTETHQRTPDQRLPATVICFSVSP